jgi:hypothetical protein
VIDFSLHAATDFKVTVTVIAKGQLQAKVPQSFTRSFFHCITSKKVSPDVSGACASRLNQECMFSRRGNEPSLPGRFKLSQDL